MNPIQHFESSAEKIWRSSMTDAEKARQLLKHREAIQAYIDRIDHSPAPDLDSWKTCRVGRARAYLAQLAADVGALAEELAGVAGAASRAA